MRDEIPVPNVKKMTVPQKVDLILAWLDMEFPCGRKVKIIWRADPTYYNKKTRKHVSIYGQTNRTPAGLTILLSKRKCRTQDLALDTLIHEWAHCMLWGPANLEQNKKHLSRDHKGAFWSAYGEIYDRLFHS